MRTRISADFLARRAAARAMLLAAMGMAAMPAHADYEFCVGSVADLDAAVNQASLPVGQSTVIKVRQGSYDITDSRLLNGLGVLNTFQMLGGYADADCATRTLNPSNTVFFEATGSANFHGNTLQGDALIEGITFRDLGYDWNQAGLSLGVEDNPGFHITLRNNIFQNTFVQIGISNNIPGNTVFENNLIYESIAKASTGFYWGSDSQGYPGAVIASLTMINNTIWNFKYGIHIGGTGYLALYNNIVSNSQDTDILTYGGDGNPRALLMVDNTYTTLSGSEQSGSSGSSSSDPKFVDADNGNFRLQNSSPAINTGTTDAPLSDVDLDGHLRVVGSTVDRGAYESGVDDTVPQTIVVTSADGSGPGTLSQAIADANANPDFTYIEFNISGSCPITIGPLFIGSNPVPLPVITMGAKIDGFTQPGSAPNTATVGDNAVRCIILDGAGDLATGIGFSGNSSTHLWVQGLAFEGFTGAALSLGGGKGDVVLGNQFGGKVGGVTLTANETDIKLASTASGALIGLDAPAFRNVIGGATDYGISIGAIGSTTTGHTIAGNLFGLYSTGLFTGSAGNGTALHLVTGGNTIENNLFAYNDVAIEMTGNNAAFNTVTSNGIGRIPPICYVINHVQHCLPDAAPNQSGIYIHGGAHDNLLQSNTIWNNPFGGVQINDAGQGNDLFANSIDANGGNGIALGGTSEGDDDAASGAANLPNRGLNAPVAAQAYGGTRDGVVDGTLDSINDTYVIQIYTSVPPATGYSRFGTGFIGTGNTTITHAPVGGNGHAIFHLPFSSPTQTLVGLQITLLATDSLGNTSEYSAGVPYLCDVIFRNKFEGDASDGCPAP